LPLNLGIRKYTNLWLIMVLALWFSACTSWISTKVKRGGVSSARSAKDLTPELIDFDPQIFTTMSTITDIDFVNDGDPVIACGVTPSLPSGLSVVVNMTTCRIAGTPTVVQTATVHTVTGTSADGVQGTAEVSITVNQGTVSEAAAGSAGVLGELPVFEGLSQVYLVTTTNVVLTWQAAIDNDTTSDAMKYLVFRATSPTGFDYKTPYATVEKGALMFSDPTPEINAINWYVVRALDSKENQDGNVKSLSAAVYPPLTFAGLEGTMAIASNAIRLTVTPATGGTGSYTYKIYLNGELNSAYQSKTQSTPDDDGKLRFDVTDLSIGTNYEFIVRVSDGITEDSNLVDLEETTLATPRATFSGAATMAPLSGVSGQTKMKIEWGFATPASGDTITSYEVYLSTNSPVDLTTPIGVTTDSVNSFVAAGLTGNTKYYAAVRVTDSNGNQDMNVAQVSATTASSAAIAFSGASSVVLEAGNAGFTDVRVSWSTAATGDFDEYRIYYSTSDLATIDPPDWNAPDATVNSGVMTASIAGLTANTNYYFLVRAAYSVDDSIDGNRNAVSITTTPSAPTFGGLSTVVKPVGMDGLSKLTLSWSAASGVFDQYKIFIKSGGNYDFNTADASVGSGTTTYTNAGLTTDQEYCYVVRAVHQVYSPILSDGNTIEVCGTPEYTTPTFSGLATCNAAAGADGITKIDLSWTAATGVFDKYAVWGPSTSSVNLAAAEDSLIADNLTNLQVSGLIPNTTYFFAVRAHYTGNGLTDGNTIILSCSTGPAYLVWDTSPAATKFAESPWNPYPKVCIQDGSGNNVDYNTSITLTLNQGAGSLVGNAVEVSTSSCAEFNDLNYDTSDAFALTATATNTISAATTTITNSWPSEYNIMFVTSTVHDGNLGGLAGADTICQNAATAEGLTDTYLALLSSAAIDALDRHKIDGPIFNMRSEQISTAVNFFTSTHDNSVSYNPNGDLYSGTNYVLTDSLSTGTRYNSSCNNWTDNSAISVRGGQVEDMNSNWITGSALSCASQYHLYCLSQRSGNNLDAFTAAATATSGEIQINLDYPIAPALTDFTSVVIRRAAGDTPPSVLCNSGDIVSTETPAFSDGFILDTTGFTSTRYSYRACIYNGADLIGTNTAAAIAVGGTKHTLFVTSTFYTGNLGGQTGADAKCQSAATSGGLSGTFEAFLGYTSLDPKDEFAILGPVFNTQGELIASNRNDLWDNSIANNIMYDENGNSPGNVEVWSGMYSSGLAHGSNCTDWTSTSGSGMDGRNYYSNDDWSEYVARGCSSNYPIYCIDQDVPASLASLTSNIGTLDGEIDVVITFPGDVTNYDHVEIRRSLGKTYPDSDCVTDGSLVETTTDFTSGTWSDVNVSWSGATATYTDTTADPGYFYSYRVCAFNENDGVFSAPITQNFAKGDRHTVFVTASVQSMNMGGLAGADTICENAATASAILTGGIGSYVAILSDDSTDAADRFDASSAPIYNTNNELVAADEAEFFSGTLAKAIKYNEDGAVAAGSTVATGSTAAGLKSTSINCVDWTSVSGSFFKYVGTSTSITTSIHHTGNTSHCAYTARIYCIVP
jgi:hypothetical protein